MKVGKETKMKIHIDQDQHYLETEIVIRCSQIDEDILRIVSTLRLYQEKIIGLKAKEIHLIDLKTIFYIESVDKKAFLYTKDDVYESPLKLYELEEQLKQREFLRASKSTIINFLKMKTVIPELGGRMIVIMDNNEKKYVTRKYANIFKEKIKQIERSLHV